MDASPEPGNRIEIAGSFDLEALIARIAHAITKIGAKRAALDSLGGILTQLDDLVTIRHELFRVTVALKKMETPH